MHYINVFSFVLSQSNKKHVDFFYIVFNSTPMYLASYNDLHLECDLASYSDLHLEYDVTSYNDLHLKYDVESYNDLHLEYDSILQ